jgi:signal transduction histidine kinase/ActR/RegA family two-component response regulator
MSVQLKYVRASLAFISEKGYQSDHIKFLKATAVFLADLLEVNCVLIDKFSLKTPAVIETVVFYGNGNFMPNTVYKLANTPCETIINRKSCSYPTNVKDLFPKDDFLAQQHIESYIGKPLWNSKKEPIGLIAFMDTKPKSLTEANNIEIVLNIIAIKIEEVLEKMIFENELNVKIEALKSSKEIAEENGRLKTEFIQNISYEIRTPLNGILGFFELLDNPDLAFEKKKLFIDVIKNSTRQLLHIIDDIMEISVLETKQIKAEENSVCINDLLHELHAIFNIKATKNKIELVLTNELSDQESTILTDKNKLNKVLSNLLENALKFTDEGIVELGCKLNKNSEPAEVEIFVKDSGIGIKPEKQIMIFERFSQAEKALSKKVGGLGLGLSIAKENATLLGGKIAVVSQLGEGAAFFVTIPYKPAGLATKVEKEVDCKKKHTILIAEDEEVNFMVLEILLEDKIKLPCTIIHAKDGLQAVEFCKNIPEIELVLMDIKMPKMDGHEATKQIKEFRPNLPVIAQTAFSSPEEKEKAFLSGCNDFIAKPINKDVLNSVINKYLLADKNIESAKNKE